MNTHVDEIAEDKTGWTSYVATMKMKRTTFKW